MLHSIVVLNQRGQNPPDSISKAPFSTSSHTSQTSSRQSSCDRPPRQALRDKRQLSPLPPPPLPGWLLLELCVQMFIADSDKKNETNWLVDRVQDGYHGVGIT